MNDTHGAEGEGWYGFDLDGTLAKYDGWKGIDHIGEPVKPMVDLIKRMHDEGKVVKIMTARVSPRPNPETAKTRYPLYVGEDVGDIPMYAARWKEEMRKAGRLADWIDACDFYTKEMWTARDFIADWSLENLGFVPEIVYQKDHLMLELYDDRVKQVVPNEGWLVEDIARSKRVVRTIERIEQVDCRWFDRLATFCLGVMAACILFTALTAWRAKSVPEAVRNLDRAIQQYHNSYMTEMVR